MPLGCPWALGLPGMAVGAMGALGVEAWAPGRVAPGSPSAFSSTLAAGLAVLLLQAALLRPVHAVVGNVTKEGARPLDRPLERPLDRPERPAKPDREKPAFNHGHSWM